MNEVHEVGSQGLSVSNESSQSVTGLQGARLKVEKTWNYNGAHTANDSRFQPLRFRVVEHEDTLLTQPMLRSHYQLLPNYEVHSDLHILTQLAMPPSTNSALTPRARIRCQLRYENSGRIHTECALHSVLIQVNGPWVVACNAALTDLHRDARLDASSVNPELHFFIARPRYCGHDFDV